MTSRKQKSLREWRKAKKLSLAQVSAGTGLSVAQLSRIETGATAGVKREVAQKLIAFGKGEISAEMLISSDAA